jgi:hypothetical protein
MADKMPPNVCAPDLRYFRESFLYPILAQIASASVYCLLYGCRIERLGYGDESNLVQFSSSTSGRPGYSFAYVPESLSNSLGHQAVNLNKEPARAASFAY